MTLDAAGKPAVEWVPVRPLPKEDTWFENVWNAFMQDKIIAREEERST